MKFHTELIKEIKNSKGNIKLKVVRITNVKSRDGISFDAINEMYKYAIKDKYKATNIIITAKYMDNTWTTLKALNYQGDNLKYADTKYFSDQPKDIRDKISRYYSIDIEINM